MIYFFFFEIFMEDKTYNFNFFEKIKLVYFL